CGKVRGLGQARSRTRTIPRAQTVRPRRSCAALDCPKKCSDGYMWRTRAGCWNWAGEEKVCHPGMVPLSFQVDAFTRAVCCPRRRRGFEVTFTVRDVAEWVQGEVVGDPGRVIRAAKPLSDSPRADEITVVLDEKYLSQFHASEAGAAVVDQSVPLNGRTLVRVKDPLMAFVTIVQKLHVKATPGWVGIHPSAVIHPTAKLGADVAVGPHVTIGEGAVIGARCRLQPGVTIGHYCKLGDDVALGPQVVVYDGCILGSRVIVHANAVIGADGFGF